MPRPAQPIPSFSAVPPSIKMRCAAQASMSCGDFTVLYGTAPAIITPKTPRVTRPARAAPANTPVATRLTFSRCPFRQKHSAPPDAQPSVTTNAKYHSNVTTTSRAPHYSRIRLAGADKHASPHTAFEAPHTGRKAKRNTWKVREQSAEDRVQIW